MKLGGVLYTSHQTPIKQQLEKDHLPDVITSLVCIFFCKASGCSILLRCCLCHPARGGRGKPTLLRGRGSKALPQPSLRKLWRSFGLLGLEFVNLLKCTWSQQIAVAHKRKWDAFFWLGFCCCFSQQCPAKAPGALQPSLMHRCFPKHRIYSRATEGKLEGPTASYL